MFRCLLPHRFYRSGLLLLALLLPAFVLLTFYQTSSPPSFILEHPYFQYDVDAEPRQDDNQLCILPRIHPFHPSVWRFITPPKKIVCVGRRAELTTVDNRGWLKFNETQLKSTGYQPDKSLKCSWSKVERGGAAGNVDDVVKYSKESPLPKEGVQLPGDVEFLRVVCRNFANFAVYDRLHAHIRDVGELTAPSKTSALPVNVLIFGLDSMSRLSFIRHLPLTYKYLTESLKMTVLRGMNKVGDNSYPNLVALLTGDKAYGGNLPDYTSGFDNWPLIWKDFSDAGYATLWAEDFPEFGLFNYLAQGFREQPTLHYLRPYWLAMKESSLLKISSHMCYGSSPRHMLQVNYLQQFISTYSAKRIPFFAFSFLAEISHEYMSRVASADAQFRDFFRWFAESGQLENTLLIVMSDHGHRFDAIRTTVVGHIEERTPFSAVRIPTAITSDQPGVLKNLLLNSGRLVTLFDMHATLVDLLDYTVNGRKLGASHLPANALGQTLFSPISRNRTCKDASIPGDYCICESETSIQISDNKAYLAAATIIHYINKLLKDASHECSVLTLSSIKAAYLVKTMEADVTDSDAEQKVRVVVEAKPSNGLFEGTVIVREDGGEIWGEVSRINPYAGQSDCIRHTILRKYCFCRDESEENFDKL